MRTWLVFGTLMCLPGRAAAEVGCIDLSETMKKVHTALYEVMLDEATQFAQDAQDGLLCQDEPVNPLVLANIFQLDGALHTFQGENAEAREAFATAVSISPNQGLDPILGEDAAKLYESVRAEALKRIPGTLEVHFSGEAWVDGRMIASGEVLEKTPGLHLLQWRNPGESMQARLLDISGAELRQVGLGLTGEAALAAANAQKKVPKLTAAAATPGRSGRSMVFGGGGMLLAGTGLLVTAKLNVQKFEELSTENHFESEEQVDSIRNRANTCAVLGIGSTAIGAGLLGVGVLGNTSAGIRIGGRW